LEIVHGKGMEERFKSMAAECSKRYTFIVKADTLLRKAKPRLVEFPQDNVNACGQSAYVIPQASPFFACFDDGKSPLESVFLSIAFLL